MLTALGGITRACMDGLQVMAGSGRLHLNWELHISLLLLKLLMSDARCLGGGWSRP